MRNFHVNVKLKPQQTKSVETRAKTVKQVKYET